MKRKQQEEEKRKAEEKKQVDYESQNKEQEEVKIAEEKKSKKGKKAKCRFLSLFENTALSGENIRKESVFQKELFCHLSTF